MRIFKPTAQMRTIAHTYVEVFTLAPTCWAMKGCMYVPWQTKGIHARTYLLVMKGCFKSWEAVLRRPASLSSIA